MGGKAVARLQKGSVYLLCDDKTGSDGYCARHCQSEADILVFYHEELCGR